jgi:hypothetical protein
MAITYEYHIKVISTDTARINKQEFPNTVRAIHWDLIGTHEDGRVERLDSITTFVKFMTRHTGSFTPYNDVTRNQVIDWIDEAADTNSLKYGLYMALNRDEIEAMDTTFKNSNFSNLPWNE